MQCIALDRVSVRASVRPTFLKLSSFHLPFPFPSPSLSPSPFPSPFPFFFPIFVSHFRSLLPFLALALPFPFLIPHFLSLSFSLLLSFPFFSPFLSFSFSSFPSPILSFFPSPSPFLYFYPFSFLPFLSPFNFPYPSLYLPFFFFLPFPFLFPFHFPFSFPFPPLPLFSPFFHLSFHIHVRASNIWGPISPQRCKIDAWSLWTTHSDHASDPPLSTASHIPVFGGHLGAVQTGLWKCRSDRSSDVSGMSSSVSTECSDTAYLPYEIRRPHHRRACQSSLAGHPRADWVQSCHSDTQSSSRKLSLIHIWRCRRIERCRSRWSPYH